MSKGKLITFAPIVCTRITRLIEARKALYSKRDNLFKMKKAIDTDLSKEKLDEKEREKLLRDYGDTIRQLDRHMAGIKQIDADLDDAVENAQQAELFEDVDVDPKKYLEPPKPTPPAGAKEGKDGKPVGRPRKNAPPADPLPDGVDQQLAASVNELDLRETLKSSVRDAGCETIGQLARWIDSIDSDEVEAAKDKFNVNRTYAIEILGAIKKFRKEHRKAAREAEGGGR